MVFSISSRVAQALCGALILAATACGESDDGGTTDPGARGDFAVVTVTSGVEFDTDLYDIRVNGISAALIDVNDSVMFANRAVDTYTVELAQVASNCAVGGDNPRPVQVVADSQTATTFEVTCFGTAGVLQVVTATSGEIPDDGYTLAVDGLDAGVIGANDTARTADLETGEHNVRLGDIALNCRLIGDPERDVLVPSEDMIETKYEVVCTDQVGNLRLETSTSGLFPDADGYEIVIGTADPITMRDTQVKTVGSVAAGVTQVRLIESSVADNCVLQGESSRVVDVPAGGLIETLFEVTCEVP